MNPILLNIFVVAFGIILTAVIAYLVRMGAMIREVQIEIAKLGTQVSPLWASVQAKISRDLHHPHPRYLEMDTLLEHLESLTITADERVRLKQLLLERSADFHGDITDEQRKKARLMIQVMDIVVLEKEKGE